MSTATWHTGAEFFESKSPDLWRLCYPASIRTQVAITLPSILPLILPRSCHPFSGHSCPPF